MSKEEIRARAKKMDESVLSKSYIYFMVAFICAAIALVMFTLPNQLSEPGSSGGVANLYNWDLWGEISSGYNFLPFMGYLLVFVVTLYLLWLMIKSLKAKKKGEIVRYPVSTLYIVVFSAFAIGFIASYAGIYNQIGEYRDTALGAVSILAIAFMALALVLVVIPYCSHFISYLYREKPEKVEPNEGEEVEKVKFKEKVKVFFNTHNRMIKAITALLVVIAFILLGSYQGMYTDRSLLSSDNYGWMYLPVGIFYLCIIVGAAFIMQTLTYTDKVGANARIMRYVGFWGMVVVGIGIGMGLLPYLVDVILNRGVSGADYHAIWGASPWVAVGLVGLATLISIPTSIYEYKAYKGIYGSINNTKSVEVLPEELEEAVTRYQKQEYSLKESTSNDQAKVLQRTVHTRTTLYSVFLILSIFFVFAFIVFLIAYFSGMKDNYVLVLMIVFGSVFVVTFTIYAIINGVSSRKEEIVVVASEGAEPLEEEKKEEDNADESGNTKEESIETVIETPETDIKIEEEIVEEEIKEDEVADAVAEEAIKEEEIVKEEIIGEEAAEETEVEEENTAENEENAETAEILEDKVEQKLNLEEAKEEEQ